MNWLEKILLGIIILLIVAVVVIIPFAIKEEMEWMKWAESHCRVVGEMSGDVFPTVGVGTSGQITTGVGFTSSKTGYQCDDGKTYWK